MVLAPRSDVRNPLESGEEEKEDPFDRRKARTVRTGITVIAVYGTVKLTPSYLLLRDHGQGSLGHVFTSATSLGGTEVGRGARSRQQWQTGKPGQSCSFVLIFWRPPMVISNLLPLRSLRVR